MQLNKQIIVDKIQLRAKPYYESPTLPDYLTFGTIVKGKRIIKLEGDFDYLEIEWDGFNVYIPVEYVIDFNKNKNSIGNIDTSAENNFFPLPINYVPANLIKIPSEWTASENSLYTTHKTFEHFNKLRQIAFKDNIDIKLTGAYKSITEVSQEYIEKYEDCFMQNTIEKPSCSLYHLGTVIDVSTNEIDYRSHPLFFNTNAYKWLEENASRFMFFPTSNYQSFILNNTLWKPNQFRFIEKNTHKQTQRKLNKKYPLFSYKKSLIYYKASNPKSKIKYLFIHDNEHTARKICRTAVKQYGGTIYEIINGHQRLLEIAIQNKLLAYDPNRIFTKKGLKENLEILNPLYKPAIIIEAVEKITILRKKLLKAFALHEKDFLLSIHTNNRCSSLSVHLFGQNKYKDSFQVHINKNHPEKNFFYTIYPEDFLFFKQKNFNVIFQKETYKSDDGSLSIWMARKKMNYITLEVQEGNYSFQKKMLDLSVSYIKRKPLSKPYKGLLL